MVSETLASLSRPSESDYQELTERLYNQRLAPLERVLGRIGGLPVVEDLTVMPFGDMAGFPVEVLFEHERSRKDRMRVQYAPSAHVLWQLRQRRSSDALVESQDISLLLASEDFSELPAAALSVASLTGRFSGSNRTVLYGSEATEERVQRLAESEDMLSYQYVHFAVHGEPDEDTPLATALRLPGKAKMDPVQQLLNGSEIVLDGMIQAEQVQRTWKLNARLVTLGSCGSNVGVKSHTEGYMGFGQALLVAGAQEALLSQWSVDDRATALLMDRFYSNLFDKKMTASESLVDAKTYLRNISSKKANQLFQERLSETAADQAIAMRVRGKIAPLPEAANDRESELERPFEHPYFWAGFVLVGSE